jgi:hypothetical protein
MQALTDPVELLERPAGRSMLEVPVEVWRAYSLGRLDGRDERDAELRPEIEALQLECDDLYRLAFDKSLRGSYSELTKLRARRLWDVDLTEGTLERRAA